MNDGVGGRIASARKLANLTQDQLAQRATYSVSMVRAVEQGREPASPGFIAAVVRALHIEPEQITGTPYYATLEESGPLSGLEELRLLLAEGSYVRATEPAPWNELEAQVAAADRALRKDQVRLALTLLPPLVRQLHGALHDASDDITRERAWGLLCRAYTDAEGCCSALGFLSLANLALDRLDWATSNTADQMYAVRALGKRARLLMAHDETDLGMSLVARSMDLIEGDGTAQRVMRGSAHLRSAIVAARGRRVDVARGHIQEARRLAAPMTSESELYGTLFGPGNVAIHSVAVELEAGDPGKAAREGLALSLPKDVAPPRVGHHWQDTARAWLLSGQPDKALSALNVARKVAPQQTRLHPSVRETLYGIAAAERRRTDSLGHFARWVGVSL